MGRWLNPSSFLVIIWDYRMQGKNIRLHLQAHSGLLPLLFAFSHQNYIRYSTPCRVNKSSIYKTPSFLGFRNFWLKTVTSRFVGQVWQATISWFWESILSGTVINSQTFFGRKSRKIWNRNLSKSFELFHVSHYKEVQLSLTWIFECFNCFRK